MKTDPSRDPAVIYFSTSGDACVRAALVGYVYVPLEPDDGRTLWIDYHFDASDRAAECVGDEAERHLASM